MDSLKMSLLFDFYGDLLTERQKLCFDLRYNQDYSMTEIAQELGVSRQGVFDNLSRAEALLHNMEEKTLCVRRSLRSRQVIAKICQAADALEAMHTQDAAKIASDLRQAAEELKE